MIFGGPDGEASAAFRYLSQKFTFKNPRIAGLLNDIGTEESVVRLYHSLFLLGSLGNKDNSKSSCR